MNVLITTQVFPPEIHPTAVMVQQLAAFLAGRGHDVTVACGHPHHPTGRLPRGWSRRVFERHDHEGIRVLRGWHALSPSRHIAVRAAVLVSQALGTATATLGAPRPDVVVNYGPPFVGPLLSAAIAKAHRARLLSVIYDIYPDVVIGSGKLTNPLAIAAARRVERAQYRLSDRILVLSEGFRRKLEAKGVPPEKVVTIPVWLETNEITPRDRDGPWRRRQGIGPEVKVVLYAGTIGLVSGARVVIEAAERLRARRDVLFLFVGEGQVKEELEDAARAARLANVRFLPFQPREELCDVQASADVSLVTLAPGRGETSVPSKVVGYMAAGRPILGSVDVDCDTAEAILSSGCGVVVPPGDAKALAEGVEELLANEEERRGMCRRARLAFEERYGAEAALRRYAEVLEALGRE
ncbi:glycosyltransferase family 4 protein [Anaeromyxobacter sp. Fw109-5]|uniref:glycosyltransferase family 4 protein n=1 Tax=Anaeromyxobacter sp. (strain Fw109-5) TaxID=404589 RepID=UPI0000ED7F4D|nr:glycosyltransferase family 4 protein [Anaeromyxobacter sp. Fw109-5]ABS25438.1 glycosyl transferase group 1 [Anaeromyxobacter sp. Fw109-5]